MTLEREKSVRMMVKMMVTTMVMDLRSYLVYLPQTCNFLLRQNHLAELGKVRECLG